MLGIGKKRKAPALSLQSPARLVCQAARLCVETLSNVTLPTREIYHQRPGMIFQGNPNKYPTEIQFPLDD